MLTYGFRLVWASNQKDQNNSGFYTIIKAVEKTRAKNEMKLQNTIAINLGP